MSDTLYDAVHARFPNLISDAREHIRRFPAGKNRNVQKGRVMVNLDPHQRSFPLDYDSRITHLIPRDAYPECCDPNGCAFRVARHADGGGVTLIHNETDEIRFTIVEMRNPTLDLWGDYVLPWLREKHARADRPESGYY